MRLDLGCRPFKGLHVTIWINHMHILTTESVLSFQLIASYDFKEKGKVVLEELSKRKRTVELQIGRLGQLLYFLSRHVGIY